MPQARALALFALAYLVLLELMLAAAILYWPSFAENLASVRSMAAPIPALGELLDTIEDTGALGYILGQHFFKGCNTLGTAAAVLFAAPAVAGEAQRGTLELLLARPVSRLRLLSERYLAGALALVLPVLLSTLTIPALAARVDEVESLAPYLLCAVHQSLFLLALYSLTFLISALGSQPTKIALALLFLATFEFALYMIKVVTHTSLYRLADIEVMVGIADRGALDWSRSGPLLLCSALCFVLAQLAFRRRTP
jgi:ABC-type transport system involved in multi-copper enzyme maturation permease subunit